jgi:putative DNA primase/helicase
VLRRREMAALIALRARTLRGRARSGKDLLVIGQKAAVDALRTLGLPPNAEAVHFNALSGLDRWREIAGMMVLGRTLPAPLTVEALAAALTNRPPLTSRGDVAWWYGRVERRIALAEGGVHATTGEEHADPTAEAVRWSICEGELVQAVGRGRGVNRTAETPLEIDLLTDVVLPVAVHEVLAWDEVRPSRHDIMATAGVEIENAADMARCFPELWPSHDAARQDGRSVRNCYYRDLHNSRSSHSSSVVSYRPAGPGQKARQARFDLALIPDPHAWLEARLGTLAHYEMLGGEVPPVASADVTGSDDGRTRLTALSARLDAAIHRPLATDRACLAALSARLEAAMPDSAAA